MIERAGIRKEYRKHFVLDETKLRKIVDVLREHAKKLSSPTRLTFYVERENNSFYETQGVDEVLADENTPDCAIRAIAIELHEDIPNRENDHKPESEKKPLAYVGFSRHQDKKVVFFVTQKERDWCFLLADELDAQVKRLIRNAPLKFIPKELIDLIVFLGLGAIVLLYLTLVTSRRPPAFAPEQIKAMTTDDRTVELLSLAVKRSSTSDWIIPINMLAMAFMLVVMALQPIARILGKMNRSVFYWGDAVPVYDRFERRVHQLKWGIGIAFIISLAASIVAALLLGV